MAWLAGILEQTSPGGLLNAQQLAMSSVLIRGRAQPMISRLPLTKWSEVITFSRPWYSACLNYLVSLRCS